MLKMLVVATLLVGCSAPGVDEDLGAAQAALCSGPPIATGSVGTSGTHYFLTSVTPWVGPPAEAYSAFVSTSKGPITGKISWGSTSDTTFRTSGCTGFDGACAGWPAAKITTLRLFSGVDNSGNYFTSFWANGSKAAELGGAMASTSLQNTRTFSDGLSRIRQDTGANSRFYFEGWDAGVWTSWSAKFINSCGSIN